MMASRPWAAGTSVPTAWPSWALVWLAVAALMLAGVAVQAVGLDRSWMLATHGGSAMAWREVAWSSLTVLGFGWSCLIVVLAADRRSGSLIALLVPVFVLATAVAQTLKILLGTLRPAATELAVHLTFIGEPVRGLGSTPSGHALAAAAACTLLALWLRSVWVGVALALVAALVGWSRVVVGAHWPSDVVIGLALGVACAAAVVRASRHRAVARRLLSFGRQVVSPQGQRAVAGLEVACGLGLLATRTGYPLGWPAVTVLAAIAAASAARRWRAASAGALA